jgi:hypothetical protein
VKKQTMFLGSWLGELELMVLAQSVKIEL